MILWVVMLMLGGAGPPPEMLTDTMRVVSEVTPIWLGVLVMQDAWHGLDSGWSFVWLAGLAVVCAIGALLFFRWE